MLKRDSSSFYFTTGAVKRMQSKEDGSLTATCQVGGDAQCSNIIPMPNGDTQGVAQHFLKYHTDTLTIASLTHTCHCHWHPPAYRLWFVHLHDLMPCPILPLSITIDKPTLFINSWLIRLWVDNVLLINTRSLSIVIDKPMTLSIGCPIHTWIPLDRWQT
jgi:hypothetical protein